MSGNDPNSVPLFLIEFAMSRVRRGEPCERCGERKATGCMWGEGLHAGESFFDGPLLICKECTADRTAA
jgi:hypothetical protein